MACLHEQKLPVELQKTTKCPKGAGRSLQELSQLPSEICYFFSHLRHCREVALTVQKVHMFLMAKEERGKKNTEQKYSHLTIKFSGAKSSFLVGTPTRKRKICKKATRWHYQRPQLTLEQYTSIVKPYNFIAHFK